MVTLLGTTTLVALLSGLVTASVWAISARASTRWSATLICPIIVAAMLYWLPVFLGASPSEYGAWAVIFIGTWSVAGVCTSLLIGILWTLTARRRRPR
jgi:hypothetical protein